MSSISSITKAVSGIKAAQKGLQVTGHNLTNINTKGYTRQHALQHETGYLNIGNNGSNTLQVGLGVSTTEIRQIRSALADSRFRTENSVLSYYETLTSGLEEITAMFDEPYGDGLNKMIQNFWSYAQKLDTTPGGVEERSSFISAANVLVKKINFISDSLETYQLNINDEVKKSVDRINEIIEGIATYNQRINEAEINGDNANDYRDKRNLLLDELCSYGEVTYEEGKNGNLIVRFEGVEVVNKNLKNKMILKQTQENSPFVTPHWMDSDKEVYDLSTKVSSIKENDKGSLKALLVLRGKATSKETIDWDDVALDKNYSVDAVGNSFYIPEVQKKLQVLTSQIADIVNKTLKGTGIGEQAGKVGVPVFVHIERPEEAVVRRDSYSADAAGEAAYQQAVKEMDEKYYKALQGTLDLSNPDNAAFAKKVNETLLAGNIQVNPELLANGGYNKLGTINAVNADGTINTDKIDEVGDNSLITNLLSEWSKDRDWYTEGGITAPVSKKANIGAFYSEFITELGADTYQSTKSANEANILITNIENERQSMGGVSQDDEFTHMLKYQYAYNASSRVITILDSMLDTLINKI